MKAELDAITLDRACRGEREALGALVQTYGERVHALVCRMMVGRPRALAEDLCQDALVKVIRGLSGFDPEGPARLSTWILTVATRTCIDHLRKERTRPELPLSETEPFPAPHDPERETGERELAKRVEQRMAALPEDQRAVLVLRAYHDLDYDEIGRALSIQVGTVKSRLARARMSLRQLMADREGAA